MSKKDTLIYIFIILAIILVPFLLISNRSFTGVDAQIVDVVATTAPTYTPWFNSILPELSSEMETFVFSAQAAIGAGVLGYILGYLRGRRLGKNI